MYIAISIAVISLIEIIVMVFFRSWEIKKKRALYDMGHGKFELFHVLHRTKHSVVDRGVGHGKHMLPKIHRKLLDMIKVTNTRVGIDKIHSIVKGRNNAGGGDNSTSSLYLKDITEHKNGVRERIENGKENIQVD